MTKRARLLAFYLPQFHPTPENDEWWGKGFTEWTNVTKAKPLFPGHYQPRLPADLGFYDLRLAEDRQAQAELARNAGIEGFCYWHYWFDGRRILERPFREVIESSEPDFPFCLAWANHSWSNHWHGAKTTLIEQTYPGPQDHERHFHAMLEAFHDPRYIRVHDRPVFTIFRPQDIPEPEAMIEQWQDLAAKNGLDGIHFVAHLFDDEIDYPWRDIGYGGAVVTNELKMMRKRLWQLVAERHRRHGFGDAATAAIRLASHRVLQRLLRWPGGVHYYKDAMLFFKSEGALDLGFYPSLVPGWDNTARAGHKGVVLHGSTPELFKEHVTDIVDAVQNRPEEDRLVFVKSWNEWAEGNYLEPDREWGHAYLNAVREVVCEPSPQDGAGSALSAPASA